MRLYAPESSGPLPVVACFHGGGWVIGNLDMIHGFFGMGYAVPRARDALRDAARALRQALVG